MNKAIPLSLILSITFAMAQEQSKKYLQKKLTVEIQNKIIASYSDLDQWLTESVRVGRANLVLRESKKWESYKGGFKISEWNFFHTAEFYEQANSARSYNTTTNILGWSSMLLMVGGIIVEGFSSNWGSGDLTTLTYIGFTSWAIGIPIGFYTMSRHKKFPVSFAVEVAEDYNKRLKKSLE